VSKMSEEKEREKRLHQVETVKLSLSISYQLERELLEGAEIIIPNALIYKDGRFYVRYDPYAVSHGIVSLMTPKIPWREISISPASQLKRDKDMLPGYPSKVPGTTFLEYYQPHRIQEIEFKGRRLKILWGYRMGPPVRDWGIVGIYEQEE